MPQQLYTAVIPLNRSQMITLRANDGSLARHFARVNEKEKQRLKKERERRKREKEEIDRRVNAVFNMVHKTIQRMQKKHP